MSGAPILIVRGSPVNPHYYDVVLEWLKKHYRDLGIHFDIAQLPCHLPEHNPYRLVVFWLQDPLSQMDSVECAYAYSLAQECRGRGVRTVNAVDKHLNLGKVQTAILLAGAGIRCPRARTIHSKEEIEAAVEAYGYPMLLRENFWHQGKFLLLTKEDDLEDVSLPDWINPIAAEFIDVSSGDGLYRKFRSVVIGDQVISHHLQISEGWKTHGAGRISNLMSREEELEFLTKPDPFATELQVASKALSLDFLAFDYGIDSSGEIVVWEANQFPHLHFSKYALVYRNFAMDRTIAAMFRFYLRAAGLKVPERLSREASYDNDSEPLSTI